MDRYFKNAPQKKDYEFTKVGRAVCVLGKTGIGKTWAVRDALDPCIHILPETLKSRQDTIDFLEKIRKSHLPVILDEYECVAGLIGLKEITRIPSEGQFIVISQIPVKFDFDIVTYQFPEYSHEEIKKIVPAASDDVIAEADGDIRWVMQSVEFRSDWKDDFTSPKDFVASLVSSVNPTKFIGDHIAEPGNMASILNANYLDSPNVKYEVVSDLFSQADTIENVVYSGDWELMPYFTLWGCILPAIEIGHTLGKDLKPGSSWTKYQNMCMRRKKIKSLYERTARMTQDIQGIGLLIQHLEKDEARGIELLKEYCFQKEDIDMLNHLIPSKKLKAKMVTHLKKCISLP